ncbi:MULTISPECIES: hypothetical protein [unclassified Nocardia]|uniref:hypothetical protein n=1 Tax=unclassified Nocardia TaxID=2637762 RepID=UPI00278C4B51|nr:MULTISPECIES: hypothetical protein [unclassified Nocardia]
MTSRFGFSVGSHFSGFAFFPPGGPAGHEPPRAASGGVLAGGVTDGVPGTVVDGVVVVGAVVPVTGVRVVDEGVDVEGVGLVVDGRGATEVVNGGVVAGWA